MTSDSLLVEVRALVAQMANCAQVGDVESIAALDGKQKALLAQWQQQRGTRALTDSERGHLQYIREAIDAVRMVCEKARDQTLIDRSALSVNRDAAKRYLQGARLKG